MDMSEQSQDNKSLEETAFRLLETISKQGGESGNTLIMLSLINLLGIINLIDRKLAAGTKTTAGSGMESLAGLAGLVGDKIDPAALLNLLKNQGIGQKELTGMMQMLGGLLGGAPVSKKPPGTETGSTTGEPKT
jgi:hypothetical protein